MTNNAAAAKSNNNVADDNVADNGRGKGSRPSYWDTVNKAMDERLAGKLAGVASIKQRLAEAADYRKAGDAKANEALAIEQEEAGKLFGLRIKKSISKEEVSEHLGDIYGFKVSASTGKKSKTPEGAGEAIRKRIVRLVDAVEYVGGESENAFFDGLPIDDVTAIIDKVTSGGSIWSAYDDLTELKKDHREKVDAAFDYKRISAIVDALMGKAEAADTIARNEALSIAYASLHKAMEILSPAIQAAKESIESQNTEA